MGLFSSKKKTYVSTVAYPLGQDDEDRVDSLKYTVLNATLQNRPVGESITQTYLRGQGMSLRNAFNYARDHYAYGVPISAARYLNRADPTVIEPLLQPKHPGATIVFLSTVVGSADFEWWAEKFLTETYGYDRVLKEFIRPPQGVEADAAVVYDFEPSGMIRILLMNADGATKVIDYRPEGFALMATFLHCSYQARTDFTELEETTTRPANVGEVDSVTVNLTILDQIGERHERRERIEIDILAGVATVQRTITVTVTSRPQYLLYRLGSGTYPTIDAWLQDDDLLAPYYPAIPLRIDNYNMMQEARHDTPLYKTSKKLLKKVGVEIEKLNEQIDSNPSVGDIDYAFVVFGVALNTKSQEGKRYLFRWFEYLRNMSGVNGDNSSYGGTHTAATKVDMDDWVTAYLAAGGSEGGGGEGGGGSASPAASVPRINTVEIFSQRDRSSNYDIKIQWNYIETTLKSGLIFAGAKPGDCDVSMGGSRVQYTLLNMDLVLDNSKLYVRRQIDADSFEEMEIAGLVHENFIYQGKSVIVPAYDAFYEADEEGFIIPLNQQIVRATPIVELTDLSYQCMHMVFNCYKVVKQKWYQSGFFKIIMIIVSIIVIWFTWGAATPAVTGFWGGMIAMVATGLAISAALASLLVATLYVLAMMIIMNLLVKVAVNAFGETWGPVIAAMVAIVAMNWESLATIGTSIGTTGITASMVLNATLAGLKIYSAYAQGQMTEVQKKLAGLETEYDRKMKEIEELSKANLDTNTDLIDIYGMTKATNLQFESAQAFLNRTLITGSDVAEITNGLIENFAEVGLQLPATG